MLWTFQNTHVQISSRNKLIPAKIPYVNTACASLFAGDGLVTAVQIPNIFVIFLKDLEKETDMLKAIWNKEWNSKFSVDFTKIFGIYTAGSKNTNIQ